MDGPVTRRGTAVPFLYYADLPRALEWLAGVFGARERFRLSHPSGGIAHAELELGYGIVMAGNVGARNRARPETVRSGVYVFVEDVASHFARAGSEGAEILQPVHDP